jgi:PAS domain S-box-containing protein
LERELSQSEALYRSVIDAVDAFIVGLRPDGEVRMWNRSATHFTELPATDVVGRSVFGLLASERTRGQLARALERALQGEEIEELELPVRTAHGRQRIVRWNVSRLPDQGGEPLLLAVGVDRTDRIELERRASEAEALASLGTLTAGLAHEIRNPLNAAALQLELLQRGADKLTDTSARDAIAGRVRIVRAELSRLSRLLDDFLHLARPRAIEQRTVDLRELVREVAALHGPAAQQVGVVMRLDLEEGPLDARGDAELLKQVLVNLVNNALEAMRERGHGSLVLGSHRKSATRVELSVEDDGPGIPAEIGDQMFAPFVTSKEAGTGLGLTVVKRIVDRHGGALHVASAPGKGTQIWVTLPGAT